MKQQALWMRLREVEWEKYEVSSGSSKRLEKIIQDVASRKRPRSMRGCHELWKLLCSGGVHSAAVPVIPFLIELLSIVSDETQMELCDILKSSALGCEHAPSKWQGDLKSTLIEARGKLVRYEKSARGDVQIAYTQANEAIAGLLDE